MAIKKLTEKSLKQLAATDPRGERYFDTDMDRKFGVTVYPSGRKVFWVVYGGRRGRHRLQVGVYGVMTLTQAKETAKELLARAAQGRDPAAERDARAAIPLYGEWVEAYLAAVDLRKKDPYEDRRYLLGVEGKRGNEARTAESFQRWASRPLDAITTADVEALVQEQAKAGHKTQANRLLASIRACLSAAWRAGYIPSNPAARVRPLPEAPPRARVLSDDEMTAVAETLAAETNPFKRAAFALLIETGARKSEVLRARWADLDLDAATWRIPSPKAGTPQTIPLAGRTVAMLRSLPRVGEFILPGRIKGKPLSDLRNWWEELREKAKLEGVTIHDLRRSFGLRVARQAGLHVASKLLRHGDVRITAKVYAPLGIDDLRGAAEQAANVLVMPAKGKAVTK